jgi:hypothetical protein
VWLDALGGEEDEEDEDEDEDEEECTSEGVA